MLGISTGTNADFLCLSSGGVVLLQGSACTISSKRFKNEIGPLQAATALDEVLNLKPVAFTMKPSDHGNRDPNVMTPQYGLFAEDVALTDPKCAVYEDDMKTPKSYRQECIISELVGAVQQLNAEIRELRGVGQ